MSTVYPSYPAENTVFQTKSSGQDDIEGTLGNLSKDTKTYKGDDLLASLVGQRKLYADYAEAVKAYTEKKTAWDKKVTDYKD